MRWRLIMGLTLLLIPISVIVLTLSSIAIPSQPVITVDWIVLIAAVIVGAVTTLAIWDDASELGLKWFPRRSTGEPEPEAGEDLSTPGVLEGDGDTNTAAGQIDDAQLVA